MSSASICEEWLCRSRKRCRRTRRVELSDYRLKFTFLCRQIARSAKCSNKPRSIVRCTKVCRRKSIGQQNFSGKVDCSRFALAKRQVDRAVPCPPVGRTRPVASLILRMAAKPHLFGIARRSRRSTLLPAVEKRAVPSGRAILPRALVISVSRDKRKGERRLCENHLLRALIDFSP